MTLLKRTRCHLLLVAFAAASICIVGAGAQSDQAVGKRLAAFPGAEGAGMFSLGGRGGEVLVVTNLADDGPGSLRAAIDSNQPRTIVFAISGTIVLKTALVIRYPRITIAGQTAPGDGITLRDYPLVISADDVVVRFIRSRLGDVSGTDDDAIGVNSGNRIMVDHVSTSWSTDEVLSVSARFSSPSTSYDNVTIQWSYMTESLNCNRVKKPQCHGFGSLLRGGRGSRVSMHHNLWASHMDRMPRPGNYTAAADDPVGGLYDFRSNVFYNWGKDRAGYNLDKSGARSSYNFVDNAYVSGPNSKNAFAFEESSPSATAFFAANSMNGSIPVDPMSLVIAHKEHLPHGFPNGYQRSTPIPFTPVTGDGSQTAYERVLKCGGASLTRDSVDLRVVNDVKTRSGKIIDSQAEVGGWPALVSKPRLLDSDGDGIPDAWEIDNELNPLDGLDGNRLHVQSGLTNLEWYLNSLVVHLC